MQVTYHAPPPDLRDLVVTYWAVDLGLQRPEPPTSPQRVFPDGCPEVIVHFGQPFRRQQDGRLQDEPRAFVFGQLSNPIDLVPQQSGRLLAARLRPSALGLLTRLPAHDLTGRPTRLSEVWGTRGAIWENRLLACSRPERAFDALSAGLRDLWDRAPTSGWRLVEEAVNGIERSQGRTTIATLSRRLGRSPRHLERLFAEHVGIAPKAYARIRRFHALQRYLALAGSPHCQGSLPGGAQVALDFGFSDQAHMIREFRKFSGMTPLSFRHEARESAPSLWLLTAEMEGSNL